MEASTSTGMDVNASVGKDTTIGVGIGMSAYVGHGRSKEMMGLNQSWDKQEWKIFFFIKFGNIGLFGKYSKKKKRDYYKNIWKNIWLIIKILKY